jgi:histidinol-phosphate/aromatic aminotransferase/cobyric acid decarboxylase-like protein
MRIADFALERYFARWEFAVEHVLCASDVEGYGMSELLALADGETSDLWDRLTLGYTESTGHPLLRREIAALYDGIEPDDVLVFAGAEEGIFCLLNVLLGPGDHAIVTWPGYQSLYEIGRATGAEVTLHELREDAGWALDLDLLRRQLTPATRLIVVNAPHNPTGMLPDRATFDGLVALAEGRTPTYCSTRSTATSSSTRGIDCRREPTRRIAVYHWV